MDSFYKLIGIICLAFLVMQNESAAHSPHHVITEVAVSPGDKLNSEVFILITDQIFKSDQQGLSWKILENGLTNQFPFTSIKFSPRYEVDGTVLASTAGDGVFWSRDRGDTWSTVNFGLSNKNVSKISVVSFGDEELRILAAAKNGGVWRYSSDENNWQIVLTESVQVQDFVETVGSDGTPMTMAGSADGRLWRSRDNGRLWTLVSEEPALNSVTSLGGDLGNLFVGTSDRGLFRSSDGGKSFDHLDQLTSRRATDCRGNPLEEPVQDHHIASINVSSTDNMQASIFVTTWFNGVFVSSDGGDSWSTWDSGLSCDPQANAMNESHYRNVVATAFDSSAPIFWVAAFDGLFRGEGVNPDWKQRETLPVGLIKGMGVALGRNGSTAIGLSTYGGGFYLTEDNGLSWTIGNRGLRTTRLTGLSFSNNFPADGVIYSGTSRSLLKSSDFGLSWAPIRLRKPAFSTRVANKLTNWGLPDSWFGSGAAAPPAMMFPTQIVQPSGDQQGRVLFGTRSHGVVAYNELSESVETLWSGTDKVINNLLMSPSFNSDNILFSSIRGIGLMRSDDGGFKWQAINDGLAFVRKWNQAPDGADFRRDIHLALSPDFQRDRTLYAGSPAGDGLYVSRDRGDSWARLPQDGGTHNAIIALAISPDFERDRMLVISVKGRGLFRSKDAGQTFQSIGSALLDNNFPIELLAFSSSDAEAMLVAASDEQLFTSTDNGDSWELIQRPVRYEDMREPVRFSGQPEVRRNSGFSAQTETLLSRNSDRVQLNFIGDGIRWLGSKGPSFGEARVSIDGEFIELVDSHADNGAPMHELFVMRGLGFGPHTIEISRVEDSDKNVAIDAFDVLPTPAVVN